MPALVGLVCLLGGLPMACSAGDTEGSGRRTGGPGAAGDDGSAGAGAAGSAAPSDFGGGPVQPGATPTLPMDPAMPTGDPAAGNGGTIEPITIDDCGADNPAGLAEADARALMAGGSGGGAMRLLYPYDATVFPRGMLAPTLMWEGPTTAEAVHVHIQSTHFTYDGCLLPTGPNQLELPQDVWDAAGIRTLGSGDPFTLRVDVSSGGTVSGPLAISFTIAQATIKGSIYYNSYSTLLGGIGGNVLRIPPGGRAEAFISNECNGCHSVSADGSRMISATLALGGRAYELTAGGAANPPALPGAPRIAFAALYPDGSKYLATFASVDTEVARANLTGVGGPPAATLYDTDTAAVMPANGIPAGAMMPMFSPDGTRLVFNDLDINAGHGLVMMDYDVGTDTATNHRVLYEDANMRPGWPFVLPDNGGVVFTLTNGFDFSGEAAGLLGLPGLGPVSDLYMADTATGTTIILARAMGYATPQDAASDTTYLPFGAEDLHKNYFPTVSPVAAGGYFWVFFDAVRHYGNLGLQRQLWGSAVTISPDGDYSVDRSHPAFYLPGQEFGTGNHRAFAALDACVQDGGDCKTGIDCCGGFCFIPEDVPSEFGEEPVGSCTNEPPSCARTDERCLTNDDCCEPEPGEGPANTCIAGFCAYVPPPD